MIKITDLIGTLSHYLETQHQLELCRERATGDSDYYSYSYLQNFKQAEATLEQTFNNYIDQRIAEKQLPRDLPR